MSFRREAVGGIVKQDPRGEAPESLPLLPLTLCLFLRSSMQINGGYEALIADIVEGSRPGCLGRIILMLEKSIGGPTHPMNFPATRLERRPRAANPYGLFVYSFLCRFFL